MEFQYISLTEDQTLLLNTTHIPIYWQLPVLQILTKNSTKKETQVFLQIEKCGQKTKQKLKSEKTRVYVYKPLLKMPFKNSISGERTGGGGGVSASSNDRKGMVFFANSCSKNRGFERKRLTKNRTQVFLSSYVLLTLLQLLLRSCIATIEHVTCAIVHTRIKLETQFIIKNMRGCI